MIVQYQDYSIRNQLYVMELVFLQKSPAINNIYNVIIDY